MSETIPVPRRRENTRLRLLEAAAQLFAEVGLDGASVEAICERAGYTRGAFYSNYESKEALFLDLTARFATERLASVRARVAELERTGTLAETGRDAVELVQQVLDITLDDRPGVLLMSEIRIRALRDPGFAASYLGQEDMLTQSVAQIVEDIARAKVLRFRLPAEVVARLMTAVWEVSTVRAAMEGADHEEICLRASEELGRLAGALIAD